MKELSLRPYPGRLFVSKSKKDYARLHRKVFGNADEIPADTAGRVSFNVIGNGSFAYVLWAHKTPNLAHELSHVILHVFEHCGIDPREANGEPFCYMLSQLMLEASQ